MALRTVATLAAAAALALGLAACGTPQQQCINTVTRDLRVVDGLIEQTQTNLNRGYALEDVTVWRTEWVECGPLRTDKNGKPLPPRMCLDEVPETRTQPKAIDLEAEARTLRQLKVKRDQLARNAAPAIAACRAQYPE